MAIKHASLAIRRSLPGRVRKAGDPGWTVQAEVGAVHGDERVAEIGLRGIAASVERGFGDDDQHASALRLAEAMKTERVVT